MHEMHEFKCTLQLHCTNARCANAKCTNTKCTDTKCTNAQCTNAKRQTQLCPILSKFFLTTIRQKCKCTFQMPMPNAQIPYKCTNENQNSLSISLAGTRTGARTPGSGTKANAMAKVCTSPPTVTCSKAGSSKTGVTGLANWLPPWECRTRAIGKWG